MVGKFLLDFVLVLDNLLYLGLKIKTQIAANIVSFSPDTKKLNIFMTEEPIEFSLFKETSQRSGFILDLDDFKY